MSELQIFGDCVFLLISSCRWANLLSGFCRPRFVFYTGSRFSQPSSWEHDSILHIKAKIQLKLRIREQSKEQLTLPWRGCYWTGSFCKHSPRCCSKCRRDVPDACLCSPPSLAHLKTSGSAHKTFCLPQGPGPQTLMLPLVLLCGLCIVSHLFLKTRGIGSCVPTRYPSSDKPGALLFCSEFRS